MQTLNSDKKSNKKKKKKKRDITYEFRGGKMSETNSCKFFTCNSKKKTS